MTTDELIAEIERLDQAATDGPWQGASDMYPYEVLGAEDEEIAVLHWSDIGGEEIKANRDLIIAYRTLTVEAAARLREIQNERMEER